jgi:hypothetical protein
VTSFVGLQSTFADKAARRRQPDRARAPDHPAELHARNRFDESVWAVIYDLQFTCKNLSDNTEPFFYFIQKSDKN